MKKGINRTGISIVFAMLVWLICVPAAYAQNKPAMIDQTPEQRASFQTGLMKNKLQLDSLQAASVQAINLKYAQKMEPVINGDEGRFKKYRAAMAIQKDKDAELKKVLSSAQYQQYQKLEEEMKDKARERIKN